MNFIILQKRELVSGEKYFLQTKYKLSCKKHVEINHKQCYLLFFDKISSAMLPEKVKTASTNAISLQ